jgi:hypothetical protein
MIWEILLVLLIKIKVIINLLIILYLFKKFKIDICRLDKFIIKDNQSIGDWNFYDNNDKIIPEKNLINFNPLLKNQRKSLSPMVRKLHKGYIIKNSDLGIEKLNMFKDDLFFKNKDNNNNISIRYEFQNKNLLNDSKNINVNKIQNKTQLENKNKNDMQNKLDKNKIEIKISLIDNSNRYSQNNSISLIEDEDKNNNIKNNKIDLFSDSEDENHLEKNESENDLNSESEGNNLEKNNSPSDSASVSVSESKTNSIENDSKYMISYPKNNIEEDNIISKSSKSSFVYGRFSENKINASINKDNSNINDDVILNKSNSNFKTKLENKYRIFKTFNININL